MKIKFITLNVFISNFIRECTAFLKKENPDVFVLQEVYNSVDKSIDKKYQTFELLISLPFN